MGTQMCLYVNIGLGLIEVCNGVAMTFKLEGPGHYR